MRDKKKTNGKPRVVIVGGGFGGVAAARALREAPVEVGLIDRRNHHLFQPLLYQVSTAALNPSDIAAPIRHMFRHQKNVTVGMGEVDAVDLEAGNIEVQGHPVPYDYLVLAAGVTHSYFGNDHWEKHAPGLKTIEDATEIRRRFLLAFEAAEIETDAEAQRAALTFVVIGGGPTGCEMAGAMAEVARHTVPADFRHVDTTTARVLLIEGAPRVLGSFSEACSSSAQRQLESLGVEVILNEKVSEVTAEGVRYGDTFVRARNIVWAAGVQGAPVGGTLGAERDRAGRVQVGLDLSLAGHPNVFVVGDQAAARCAKSGKPVPGVAQGAIQGGAYVGKIIAAETRALQRGQKPPPRDAFTYFDKGSMATIGKNKAVADAFGLRFGGFPAWLAWAGVHILFLVDFRSKIAVGLSWAWTYLRNERGARLITGESALGVEKPPTFD